MGVPSRFAGGIAGYRRKISFGIYPVTTWVRSTTSLTRKSTSGSAQAVATNGAMQENWSRDTLEEQPVPGEDIVHLRSVLLTIGGGEPVA